MFLPKYICIWIKFFALYLFVCIYLRGFIFGIFDGPDFDQNTEHCLKKKLQSIWLWVCEQKESMLSEKVKSKNKWSKKQEKDGFASRLNTSGELVKEHFWENEKHTADIYDRQNVWRAGSGKFLIEGNTVIRLICQTPSGLLQDKAGFISKKPSKIDVVWAVNSRELRLLWCQITFNLPNTFDPSPVPGIGHNIRAIIMNSMWTLTSKSLYFVGRSRWFQDLLNILSKK